MKAAALSRRRWPPGGMARKERSRISFASRSHCAGLVEARTLTRHIAAKPLNCTPA
jgi:hypothetical protein